MLKTCSISYLIAEFLVMVEPCMCSIMCDVFIHHTSSFIEGVHLKIFKKFCSEYFTTTI